MSHSLKPAFQPITSIASALTLLLALLPATGSCRDPKTGGWKAPSEPRPLIHAHAHNDYEHERPLFDALSHGFCSVEADIYLVQGQLLVAHNRSGVKPDRTLQSLYLDPLRTRVKQNGGRVYANGPECTLLVDIKSDWHSLYPVLRKVLSEYSDMLTTFSTNGISTNAIRIILSGNRAPEMFNGESLRYAAMDGTLDYLKSDQPRSLIPWISSNWGLTFHWNGKGEMPEEERQKLKQIVAATHVKGRLLRFWGAPDQPNFWRQMMENGVDLINTDDLAGAEKFFQGR
jgi:hypothetical protein